MTPLQQSNNIAARMGRWSASHRKTAIFGWLAFVVAAFSLSMVVGLRLIDENDVNVGEARAADHIVREAGFPEDEQSEIVIVQSKGMTMDDPAFRAVVVQALGAVSAFEQVDDIESPLAPGNADLISEDRHAAMIPFRPRGDYLEASLYIDTIVASIAEVQKANPDYYVGSVGTSTDKALDSMFGGMLALAGLIAIPLTFGMLLLVFRSLVAALVPLLLALTSVIATMGRREPRRPARAVGTEGLEPDCVRPRTAVGRRPRPARCASLLSASAHGCRGLGRPFRARLCATRPRPCARLERRRRRGTRAARCGTGRGARDR